MTNLSMPVASATQEASHNNMPDVIDALKRLERIGNDQSKTVQKILEAAHELEELIVKQYGRATLPHNLSGFPGINSWETDESTARKRQDLGHKLGVDPRRAEHMWYELDWKPSAGATIRRIDRVGKTRARVSQDREAVLQFSRDIADGLLALIEHDLQLLQEENISAMEILAGAKNAINQKRNPT
jgi:hypothetical protein